MLLISFHLHTIKKTTWCQCGHKYLQSILSWLREYFNKSELKKKNKSTHVGNRGRLRGLILLSLSAYLMWLMIQSWRCTHSQSFTKKNVIYRNLKIVLQIDQVLGFLLSHLNKTRGRPFLCSTMMPSRQDPRVTSVPVLSCLDDEKNTCGWNYSQHKLCSTTNVWAQFMTLSFLFSVWNVEEGRLDLHKFTLAWKLSCP